MLLLTHSLSFQASAYRSGQLYRSRHVVEDMHDHPDIPPGGRHCTETGKKSWNHSFLKDEVISNESKMSDCWAEE